MGRPRKNPLPANVVTEKDSAAVETNVAAPEVQAAPEEEVKPVKRVGRPAGSTKAKTEAKKAAAAAKAEAKKTVKKAAEKVEKAEKKVAEVKRAGRAPKNPETVVIIQFEGKNIETKNVVEAAKKNWVESGKREASIKSIEVYINVTEGMAYPVINGEAQDGFSC